MYNYTKLLLILFIMTRLTWRNLDILRIIIEEYLQSWDVLGSKLLLKKYDIWVSSATVRGDMAKLEKLDLVFQPYNSAWRLPTAKGLRVFVNYLMEQKPDHFLAPRDVKISYTNIKSLEDSIYQIVYNLAKTTWEIAFVTIPEDSINVYSWIADFLELNYKFHGEGGYHIIRMIEDKFSFIKFIESLNIWDMVSVIIGQENILEYLKDYSIVVRAIEIEWRQGVLWIIWWLKMDYSFNISAVRGVI